MKKYIITVEKPNNTFEIIAENEDEAIEKAFEEYKKSKKNSI